MKGKFFLKKDKKEKKCNGKKKVIIIAVSLVTVLVVVGGVAFFALRKKGNVTNPNYASGSMGNWMGNMGSMGGMSGISFDGVVTASGVINMGTTEENFEVEGISARLQIEEVYVSSGQKIAAGDKVLKVTEESIAGVKAELESLLETAELAYRAGAIEYEQSKITARADYETALLSGSQAEAVYQDSMDSLDSSIERAKEQLAEAQAQIAEYEKYVNDGSYKAYFKVDEYQAIYDENLQLLRERMEEWGVSWSEVVSGNASGGASGGGNSGGNGGFGDSGSGSTSGGFPSGSFGDMSGFPQSDEGMILSAASDSGMHSQYVTVLSGLYNVLEDNLADLEQAQSDYEDAVANAALQLQTLKLQLPSLEQAVEEAENSYELEAAQAKLTYESTVEATNRAQEDYENELSRAESTYEDLLDAYETAKEELAYFESSFGDGYYYAQCGGTIVRMSARANQRLSAGATILSYSDAEEMTLTVSVDQTDIAKLTVGEEAYIMADRGGCMGVITSINPVTASDSRTNITYRVSLTVNGAESGFSANESVTVMFGVTEEDVQGMNRGGSGWGNMGGQMPEGFDPESMGGRMPEGFDPESMGGRMPQGMPGWGTNNGGTGNGRGSAGEEAGN